MAINQGKRRLKSLKNYKLRSLYPSRIPISNLKRKDLVTLCNRGLIPSKYHSFYVDMPYESREDALPEPNSSDDSDLDE
jgi:hypothetical protein